MNYLILLYLVSALVLLYLIKEYFTYLSAKKLFNNLIEHAHIGYCRYRFSDGVILSANKGFIEILELDFSRHDVLGRSLSELIIYLNKEDAIREKIKKRGEIRNYEYSFKTAKGKTKSVLANAYIIKDSKEKAQVIEMIFQDITEERKSYEKMKESQERYRKLFKDLGDMLVICNLTNLKIEEINPVTEIITGYTEQELIDMSLDQLLHPSLRDKLYEAREDLLFKGASRAEMTIVCKNGTYKEVFASLNLVDIKDETKIMALIKDVSEMMRKRDEEMKRKKELEDFWKASVQREERINELKQALMKAENKLSEFKKQEKTNNGA